MRPDPGALPARRHRSSVATHAPEARGGADRRPVRRWSPLRALLEPLALFVACASVVLSFSLVDAFEARLLGE